MTQDTLIIAGFPGVGKSHFHKNNLGDLGLVSDSDSSLFSKKLEMTMIEPDGEIKAGVGNRTLPYTRDRKFEEIPNPDFPQNYIDHIKSKIEEGKKLIFVSTHKQVIDALIEADLEFTIVYPDRSLLVPYLDRYIQRNSSGSFIKLIMDKWDSFIDDLESVKTSNKIKKVVLTDKEMYLAQVIEPKYVINNVQE